MRKHVIAFSLLAISLSARSSASKVDSQGAGTRSAASPSSASSSLNLKLPKKATYLVPVSSGTQDEKLRPFFATGGVYTIHVQCTGKGTTSIEYKGSPKSTKITCNNPASIGQVYTDEEKQNLTVRIHGSDIRWSIAILAESHKL
ncbi:hypothetical protein [Streptomyces nodosus]|uniref:hypothetical protein n=1 Tax=Streptomyces nodosus TaxID=40318 RepID=UPI003826CD41